MPALPPDRPLPLNCPICRHAFPQDADGRPVVIVAMAVDGWPVLCCPECRAALAMAGFLVPEETPKDL